MSSLVLSAGRVSFASSWRELTVALVLAVVLLDEAALCLVSGDYPLSASQVWSVLIGGGSSLDRLIIVDVRLTRTLVGIGAGLALGMSGAITQVMLRNPLAAPDIVGISAGASLGAMLSVGLAGGYGWLAPGAVLGGLVAAALVLALAWQEGLSPLRLILVGIGVNLCLVAIGDISIARLDLLQAADLMRWLIGSFSVSDWADVRLIGVGLLLLCPVLLWAGFLLGRLGLSDDVALGLGLRVSLLRLILMVVAVVLVALAIAVAGPLPFVAFVAGPIARALVGQGRAAILPAGLIGAIICLLADLAGRNVLPGYTLPAGVFTALVGAPLLIGLLVINIRKRAL